MGEIKIANMQEWWLRMRQKFLQQKQEGQTSAVPLHHGVLTRGVQFKDDFEEWKNSIAFRSRIHFLRQQIEHFVNQQPTHEGVTFLHSAMSAGIVMDCQKISIEGEEANFLLDFFNETILQEPYRLQLHDTKTTVRGEDIITINRYYLKPKINRQEKPYNQQYGNIYLELLFLNARACQFKVQLNYYSDATYQAPYSVHKFYETIVAASR